MLLQHFEEFAKDAGIPADDFPSMQVSVSSGKVAYLSSGLLYNELAGSHIPRLEAVFEEDFASPGSHGSQVESGRS